MPHVTNMDRFWSKVNKRGPNDCWVWTAGKLKDGYGAFKTGELGREQTSAHRYSYRLAHGEIPPGMVVCHRCDNPPCVNPAHLFLGTQRDNQMDKITKGRANTAHGRALPHAKLDETSVRLIRARTDSAVKVAADFGVSPSVIDSVRHRRSWKHVA